MKEELRTLQEQQAEAWRMAPDDAEWIAQDGDGEWFAYFVDKPYQRKGAWDRPYGFACFFGEINGWDWRDTLQSRKEFEEMKPSELEKANGDHKEDFVPQVGDTVRFNWKRQGDKFWQLNEYMQGKIDYITSSGVVIDDCFFDYADDTVDIQPVKSKAEKRREEQIEKMASLANTTNFWSAKQYDAGCRMTRDLTDDVIDSIWYDTKKGDDFTQRFAKAIAAYVTGVSDVF